MEEVLKHFMVKKDCNLDIPSKAREIFNKRILPLKSSRNDKNFLKSEWFKQRCVLLHNIPQLFIPEYLIMKFNPFSESFKNKFGFNIQSLWLFSFKLLEYLNFKKYVTNFKDEVYKFKSKEEYADLGFVAVPPALYIEKWKNVITNSISELERVLSGLLSSYELKEVVETFSISWDNLDENKIEINFSLKPLLKINDDTLIVLNPEYLTRALPVKCEQLFKDIKEYRDAKGKTFEATAQATLKMLPFKSLSFNVEYGAGYEADAILEFEKSVWFVEVTSHPPSDKALEGDLNAIKRDLKRSIIKCIKQGKRCFDYSTTQPLSTFFAKRKINGILVIVDGIYPQLNLNNYVSFFKEKMPIYVINWFDLRTLAEQPEIGYFEDFLLWRTQQPMPIISFDEKDYWAFYFDRYIQDERMRETFRIMQEKNINAFYISYRFNNKEYLENLA
ncbi:MAG: hypothetical protein ABIL91_07950 [candidate division WOR-3 bacterium]